MRIGIDTGGTFTDVVMVVDGGLRVHKVRSTPDDPSRAILQGIREIGGSAEGSEVAHGSTVATNAVLERKGARVALLATAGFEDFLRIGRQTRSDLYDIFVRDRPPLVEDGLSLGVTERIAADGEVLLALEDAESVRLIEMLRARGAESIAICFLHSYRNPAHERRLGEQLRAAGFKVSESHRVLCEYREFERGSTTVLNAYVTPVMARYLDKLEAGLPGSRLRILQSSGGAISAESARQAAVQTVLSGPAAGVVGAEAVARAAGCPRAISFDMGGTSTDVSLIDGGIGRTSESFIGDFPMRLPSIDIHTVGAGGGSIAWIDSGGALRVGPQSAGADPGPACYGAGSEVTVTDANLLLGRIDPEYFLGGRMKLDVHRARQMARALAKRLGVSPAALAEGIVRVANSNMERAIRVVSVQRGHDPRDFALVAFGGAGGLHACDLAQSIGIGVVLAPRHAGVLSALGTLLADITRDYSLTILWPAETAADLIELAFEPLVKQANEEMRREGFAEAGVRIERSLDMRYVGQSYEIAVPLEAGYRDAFDRSHARLYGYSNPGRPAEIVNLRVRAVGVTVKPVLPRVEAIPAPASTGDVRPVRFGARRMETRFYRREALSAGAFGAGPAVITSAEATFVVPPRFEFEIDNFLNVIARPRRDRERSP